MVRIQVLVKPRSKQVLVEKVTSGTYRVQVKEPAQDGKANRAVLDALGEYFGLPKTAFQLTRGQKSKQKVIEIDRDIEV